MSIATATVCWMNAYVPSTLVLGGSRGIGKAVAARFVAAGSAVFATHRGSGVADDVVGIEADLREPDTIRAAVSRVVEEHGRLDNLVVAGGMTRDALLLRQSSEDLDEVLQTNLIGPIHAVKAALKPMLRSKSGSVVLISSISARLGVAGQTNYTASKGGLEGFAHSCAREYASRGIRMNVVAPGPTDTAMMASVPPEERRVMEESVPLGRLGRVEEIADVVYWVSQSTFMTGAVVPVAGGLQAGY